MNYPRMHFTAFLELLDGLLRSLLAWLSMLLSRFIACSAFLK